MPVHTNEDLLGAIILTGIIVTLSIGLIWSLAASERLRRELEKKVINPEALKIMTALNKN